MCALQRRIAGAQNDVVNPAGQARKIGAVAVLTDRSICYRLCN